MFTQKAAARKHYLSLRASIANAEILASKMQSVLFDYLIQKGYASVMLYIAIGSEAKTAEVINLLSAKGVAVWLPHTTAEGEIIPAPFCGWDKLIDGPFRTKQPMMQSNIPFCCDAVVVPGVAFDFSGNRLGYGKGCYDSFLADFIGEKIGYCYFQQIGAFPTQTHDKIMDVIITEKGVHHVKRGN